MPITRILWDELIKDRLYESPKKLNQEGLDKDIRLILMALQDIDNRIDDLEEEHNEMIKNANTK